MAKIRRRLNHIQSPTRDKSEKRHALSPNEKLKARRYSKLRANKIDAADNEFNNKRSTVTRKRRSKPHKPKNVVVYKKPTPVTSSTKHEFIGKLVKKLFSKKPVAKAVSGAKKVGKVGGVDKYYKDRMSKAVKPKSHSVTPVKYAAKLNHPTMRHAFA